MAATQPMMKTSGEDSTTRELVLSLFSPELQKNRSLQALADRVETFTRAGTRRARLDALVELYDWIRARDTSIPSLANEPAFPDLNKSDWRRERVWLSILQASAEIRDRYLAGVAAILEETDGISLFAESGLPSDRGSAP